MQIIGMSGTNKTISRGEGRGCLRDKRVRGSENWSEPLTLKYSNFSRI